MHVDIDRSCHIAFQTGTRRIYTANDEQVPLSHTDTSDGYYPNFRF